ncbi:XrtA/PEP-CTERM system amidotransferase [Nitrosococcus wardiae]|uniref:asparagine synthase (glutamine-hydrolyzing) n=1 Tax=Nitrosococcus wardiae TaxID=1814290 RepID=A0A4P7BWY4_9GAMM|nr:XrtA/PEP-CTERM system amidotransferase [Nitrosococcus wardiae]QBQ54481.1 amidotransferase 1, exosortase A system-associated [Nitrosococcus wardiae]
MCGIAGIFDIRLQREINRNLLTRMNQALFHRGPDEGGLHLEPGLGLAHRRLSIIDLASGQQPLFNEDGSVAVVYNGEIYNFQELSAELVKLGHVFRTRCDTEVIVHAWEEWGERCVERFRGMFAFAVWDRNRRSLFLARDRVGIKPLHYVVLPSGHLLFASELKALMIHPDFPREFAPPAIEDYFAYGYIPDPKTFFKGVFKLLPGHTLTVQWGKPVPEPCQYWNVSFKSQDKAQDKVCQELLEELQEAVRIRLIAEVPLGAFLSGGVDSSAVVAMMSKLSNTPVNTCSISFGEPAFNEAQYAAQVAARYQTHHYLDKVESNDFNLLDRLAEVYDEPFADNSAIPTYRVCELARKRVTVALSGDGGDEIFAGYRRYRWHIHEERVRNLFPSAIRRPLFSFLAAIYPQAEWVPRPLRAKTTFQELACDSIEGYFHNVSLLPDGLRSQLFSHAFKENLQGYQAIDVLRAHLQQAPDHPLSRAQYLDFKTYLPGDILTKVDRASMAHGLEVRVPILDHQFVEWAAGISPTFKLQGGNGKYIFKQALAPYLSEDILYRPKMGFAVPLAAWFRGPLRKRVRQAVLSPLLADSGIFDMGFLGHMVDDHEAGRRDYSAALWALLMFEASWRRILEGREGASQVVGTRAFAN